MTLSEKLVLPISEFKFEQHPAAVVEKAKLCVLHSISCAFAGIDERWSAAVKEMTCDFSRGGDSTVWFSDLKTNMADAAFADAVFAQSILYEDIHRDSNAHPGVIIIPAALAMGEALHRSGKDVLNAIIAGYEMMGRFGRGTACPAFGSRGFRPTSIIGVFGSCAAAGLLLGLTPEQQVTAFGLAATFASGVNEWAIAGTDDLYFQNGCAARGGIVAAQLAKRGVTAPKTIVEGPAGICAAFGFSRENLEAVNMHDGKYVITDVLFKPAPACALVQTTAQAALQANAAGIAPEDVRDGVIHTFALGKSYAGCDYPGPFSTLLQARMSNQFNFASAFVHGRISNADYQDFGNTTVGALAGRMKVEVDPAYTAAFPAKQPVRLELRLADGTVREFYQESPVYLTEQDVLSRFRDHFSKGMSAERTEEAIATIRNLENLSDVAELPKYLLK